MYIFSDKKLKDFFSHFKFFYLIFFFNFILHFLFLFKNMLRVYQIMFQKLKINIFDKKDP